MEKKITKFVMCQDCSMVSTIKNVKEIKENSDYVPAIK